MKVLPSQRVCRILLGVNILFRVDLIPMGLNKLLQMVNLAQPLHGRYTPGPEFISIFHSPLNLVKAGWLRRLLKLGQESVIGGRDRNIQVLDNGVHISDGNEDPLEKLFRIVDFKPSFDELHSLSGEVL
jgi:hypothetical protein